MEVVLVIYTTTRAVQFSSNVLLPDATDLIGIDNSSIQPHTSSAHPCCTYIYVDPKTTHLLVYNPVRCIALAFDHELRRQDRVT